MSTTSFSLAQQQCEHRTGAPLSNTGVQMMLSQVQGWSVDTSVPGGVLHQTFTFANFHETMAFVNAVAWIAHQQDHHPELFVAYNRCTLRWNTHSVGGLSANDFICAARVDTLNR